MTVFELYAAYHMRHLVDRAKCGGPVRDGEPRIVAGDQRPGDDENKRDARRENRKAVKSAIVWSGDSLQNELLGPMNRNALGKDPALPDPEGQSHRGSNCLSGNGELYQTALTTFRRP